MQPSPAVRRCKLNLSHPTRPGRLLPMKFPRLMSAGALALLLLPLASSTSRLPAVSRPLGFAWTPVQGPKPDPAVLAQFGLYNNAKLQTLIDTKGQQMNRVSDRPGDYGFTIVDSPVINAFATPDGHVYFTRGIMAYFNNEAQFAGVLGPRAGPHHRPPRAEAADPQHGGRYRHAAGLHRRPAPSCSRWGAWPSR